MTLVQRHFSQDEPLLEAEKQAAGEVVEERRLLGGHLILFVRGDGDVVVGAEVDVLLALRHRERVLIVDEPW